MVHADLQGSHALQQTLLQIGADAHDLSRGLHLGAQRVGGGGELVEGESRELGNAIIQPRLEGGVGVGDLNVLKKHTNGNFCRHTGNGIARRLGRQCRGAGHSGVDLNQIIFTAVGVERELYVTAALDLQLPNDTDRRVVEHLLVMLGQRHNGSDHQGVARVNTHRINILHAADGNGVIRRVAHDLKLNLLVALHTLFDQNLMYGRKLKGVGADLHQLRLVVGKAATRTAKRKGGTKHHGISDPFGCFFCLLKTVRNLRGNDGLTNGLTKLLEQLSVLCPLNALAAGTQQLHAALLQNSLFFQLHRQIQARLSADSGNDGIGTLVAKNLRNVFKGQGLHVYLVRNGGIRHDRGRIGVHQNHLVSLLLQSKTRLRSRIVKFCRLTDHDGTGANN